MQVPTPRTRARFDSKDFLKAHKFTGMVSLARNHFFRMQAWLTLAKNDEADTPHPGRAILNHCVWSLL